MKKIKIILALTVLVPLLSMAQTQTKKVAFAAGKSSTVVSGTVKGYGVVDYLLDVKQNQTISVSMQTKNNSLYFNVIEPGAGEAIYMGENDGTNKFSGTSAKSGVYKIRVFLYRNAARNGTSATYSLNIGVKGAGASGSGDAKVAGTKYNATGNLDAALGSAKKGSSSAKFGVIRNGGSADIDVQIPGLLKHRLHFVQSSWSCDGGNSVKSKKVDDEWEVIINDYEHYYIVDGMIYGG